MPQLVVSLPDILFQLFNEVLLLLLDVLQILALFVELMPSNLLFILLFFPEPFIDGVLFVSLQLVEEGVLDLLVSVDRDSSWVRFSELFVFGINGDLGVHFPFDCVSEFLILRLAELLVELHHIDDIFLDLGKVLDPEDGVKVVDVQNAAVLGE